jgi:alkanesulfonate monooxygenase SsuD/methylene tetrahydromethanopterin reductase-like flavin-dependent oxidoreductase (luciferase family)
MTEIGLFVVPSAEDPALTLNQALLADEVGLDYLAVQDHPYQRHFFDTWTLLSYIGARTNSIRLVTDVINLPLRMPSVFAKAAASLDVLSGGRVEIGIGVGGFWDAIEAMGGPRRTPKESVDALIEAVAIMRDFWTADGAAIDRPGDYYSVVGAKGGPPPAHEIGLWFGAYGPRMLRVTGRLANGWLPSMGGHYLKPEYVPPMQAAIDEAAGKAGRDPSEVKRVVNIMALEGDPAGWTDQLVSIAALRFETLLVGVPSEAPLDFIRRLGEEIAPAVRAATS